MAKIPAASDNQIPAGVSFKEGPGGLAVIEIVNSHAKATIALQGAHVMTWAPHDARPVIWLSRAAKFAPGKSIRGGVPICWPWFGPHASEAKFPGHGFARTVPWDFVSARTLRDGSTALVLRITENDTTRMQWPHSAGAEMHITVGTALTFDLVTRNTGKEVVTVGDALHTYFEVSDVRDITIHGLGACPYIDKVDGAKRKQQVGAVKIDGEVDRVYLDSVADCLIDDPRWNRRIRISKRNSRATVVWNPGIEKAEKMGDFGPNGYLDTVCVESANAAEDVVAIAPGHEHHLWVRYSLEAR